MTTAAMAPFPHMAGAASALSGFLQMGSGMVGGLAIAAFADPVTGLGTVIPTMGLISILCFLFWRRLPEPALANVKPVTPPETPLTS